MGSEGEAKKECWNATVVAKFVAKFVAKNRSN
jgi:hypothetical protein